MSSVRGEKNTKGKSSRWLAKKKARVEQLKYSVQHIRETYGFLPLLIQIVNFLSGKRKNGKFNDLDRFIDSQGQSLLSKNLPDEITYEQYIQENEPTEAGLEIQKSIEMDFNYRPLISIITPVYNTDLKMLRDMIESVFSQTYSNWELCLIDGCSTKLHVRPVLEDYQKIDHRIKVKFLDQNLGISGNSNAGISMIKGEFTALLDHDDLLSPNALFEIVKLLNENQSLDFIYSDKDTISTDGLQRYSPLFKPEWSPDILLNANYLTHLNIIRTKLLREIEGGFDRETDGAQDWDIFFRITSLTNKIAHIPKILYHWRSHSESTALNMEAKPYASGGQLYCIQKFLKTKGFLANANFNENNMLQIEWQNECNSSLSLIIYNNGNTNNINSFVKNKELFQTFPEIEFIILNHSNSKLSINESHKVKILNFKDSVPLGKIYQSGVNISSNKTLVFLDADLKPHINSLGVTISEMVNWAQPEEIGIVGGMLLYPNNRIACTGLILGNDLKICAFGEGLKPLDGTLLGNFVWYRNFSAIPRQCFAVKKNLIDQVGGFDIEQGLESHIDLNLKLRSLNVRNFYTPNAIFKFKTVSKIDWQLPNRESLLTSQFHEEFFRGSDPYFNTNLVINDGKPFFKTNKKINSLLSKTKQISISDA